MRSVCIGLICMVLAATGWGAETEEQKKRRERVWEHDILSETFGFDESSPSDYPWENMIQGCPERDCIRSIDQPRFVPAAEADYLHDDDLVMAVAHNGVKRVYPTRILVHHEIVNDTVAGLPVCISYCPLCGSGLAFRRELDGEAVEFGVSGVLHNSDLVMYDRKTDSLWQQITGTAFAGPSRGTELETVPMAMTTWAEWRAEHPESEVLSNDTGFPDMDYSGWPYGDYNQNDRVMFPVSLQDARLHPKRVVFGVDVDGVSVAYDQDYLKAQGEIRDAVGGRTLQVRYRADGSVEVQDAQSGERWNAHRMFWFAWYSFHPTTLLRDGVERD